ncbi:hypothetical protein DNTS_016130 [Danionella cerebrum]|uniref:Uncharacterized protein n=1 Tax=Danionella cerebrum TaxID=2873325 RepID=A0A553Q8R8_9TELE|nr:hypothetical protein DNTS_016130 [Danionella translucida]
MATELQAQHQTQSGVYTFSSRPRAVPSRPKYRPAPLPNEEQSSYGNIMYDRRVVRGNTYAQHILPSVSVHKERLQGSIPYSLLTFDSAERKAKVRGRRKRRRRGRARLTKRMTVPLGPDGTNRSVPEARPSRNEDDRCDVQEVSSSTGSLEESEMLDHAGDDLTEIIQVANSGNEQLKQLQAAVEKRNEIISQLSKNLQVALQSRDQVQLEAQQLTDQIQALQQQLQQV